MMDFSFLHHIAVKTSSWQILYALVVPLGALLVSYIAGGVRQRLSFRGLPGPPHSFWLGSIPAMAGVMSKMPANGHPEHMMTMLHHKYDLGGVFFLDSWPAESWPFIVICDPQLAAQVTQKHSLPKSPLYKTFIGHLVGDTSMVFANGAMWKSMRSIFNSGFTSGHLKSFVPEIIDHCLTFCDALTQHATRGDIFILEEATAGLAVDVIGSVVLGFDLKSQSTENALITAMRKQAGWCPLTGDFNPFKNLNPVRPFMIRYYGRIVNDHLERVFDQRVEARRIGTTRSDRKPAVDLAVGEYIALEEEYNKSGGATGDFKAFKGAVIDQLKTFLFAGHDTTSSTICYIFYMLSLHPEKLEIVLEEHRKMFGSDVSTMASQLKQNPQLLNNLPYTVAVMRETLRMYPIGSSMRMGDESSITYEGRTYPTKGCVVIPHNHILGRRADLFPCPDEFIPERFLPAPHNFQEVPKDAWRPFEKGPRNCIGQELAMLEMKIVMVLTLRKFSISAAYEEWDVRLGRKKPGEMLGSKEQMFGYRGYQILVATAKPVDGMPARVTMRTMS